MKEAEEDALTRKSISMLHTKFEHEMEAARLKEETARLEYKLARRQAAMVPDFDVGPDLSEVK